MLKCVSSLFFIVLGVTASFASGTASKLGTIIILGQIFSICGDIFLDLKYVYTADNKIYTFSGFISFLITHFCFLLFLLFAYPSVSIVGIVVPFAASLGLGLFTYFKSEKLMHFHYGSFSVIAALYISFLLFVTLFSFFTVIQNGICVQNLIFLFGIVLFLASDFFLSQIYFIESKNTKSNVIINLVLYYLGQILIAYSIYFIR